MMVDATNILLDNANRMSAKAVQISLDETMLRRIDADPHTRRAGRSAFIREAVELYLATKKSRAIDASIKRAYADSADDMRDDARALMDAQAWPAK
jgi:metal-responsive CopG/Arc/MetJ family transcriptional regulator